MIRARLSYGLSSIVVTLALGWSGSALALPLSIGNITGVTLDGLTGSQVGATIVSDYDFDPPTPGGDGQMSSAVFEGTGAAAGNFVYLYQIELFSDGSEDKISGTTVDWTPIPLDIAGVGQSFFVGDDGGSSPPFLADFGGSTLTFVFFPFVAPGTTTHTFGVVSPNAPQRETATLLDSGVVFAHPEVYTSGDTPVPEAAQQLQLLAGLLVVALALHPRLRTR